MCVCARARARVRVYVPVPVRACVWRGGDSLCLSRVAVDVGVLINGVFLAYTVCVHGVCRQGAGVRLAKGSVEGHGQRFVRTPRRLLARCVAAFACVLVSHAQLVHTLTFRA